MTQSPVKQRIQWLAVHGFVRGVSKLLARRGDPQGRLIADPAVRENPVAFTEELRARGPIVKCRALYMTVDHKVANDLLRSDDFHVFGLGSNLPKPLQWLADRTKPDLLHPIQPPSMLSVEPPDHTRYRKLVSSVFTTRAVAALRERVQDAANTLLDELAEDAESSGSVDIVERYCSQLPVTIIGDILGVPDDARPRILEFGELAAPSLDVGLTWRQYKTVYRGIEGFNDWLSNHLHELRRNPGDDLMSQIIRASEAAEGGPLTHKELLATAGLVLAAGFETTVNLLGNGIRMLLDSPGHLDTLATRPELWPTAVEEILRLDSPVQLSARIAAKDTEIAGYSHPQRRRNHHLPRRRQPRPEGLRRPAHLRHRTRECGQASVVLGWAALLSRRGVGPRRGRGRATHVLRTLPRRPTGRRWQPARHPRAARMVVTSDQAWHRAQPL